LNGFLSRLGPPPPPVTRTPVAWSVFRCPSISFPPLYAQLFFFEFNCFCLAGICLFPFSFTFSVFFLVLTLVTMGRPWSHPPNSTKLRGQTVQVTRGRKVSRLTDRSRWFAGPILLLALSQLIAFSLCLPRFLYDFPRVIIFHCPLCGFFSLLQWTMGQLLLPFFQFKVSFSGYPRFVVRSL